MMISDTATAAAIAPPNESNTVPATTPATEEPTKKRGRRKKIVSEKEVKKTSSASKKEAKECKLEQFTNQIPAKNKNVILHLRCSLQDIDDYIRNQTWKSDEFAYDPKVPVDILPYESTSREYHPVDSSNDAVGVNGEPTLSNPSAYVNHILCSKCEKELNSSNAHPSYGHNNPATEEWTDKDTQKIKDLKIQFYKQDIPDKKVDCFWCTCPYDNDPFFVLQHGSEGNVIAHGSYCSPQCATAYLFQNMHWDDSATMESYQLMNYYYGDPNKRGENIKPACSPFYTLDKYYGNMTIQEYRKLSNSNYMLLCLEKPVSRVLPEIHEDNDKTMNTQSIRGNYKVKKQSEKTGTINRNEILKSNFGV